MKTNSSASSTVMKKVSEPEVFLAGGSGAPAAKQEAEALLRRATLACLLWEDSAYEDGKSTADNIAKLIPTVPPDVVAAVAVAARTEQKLRHAPLFMAREMARYPGHNALLAELLPKIILRADELAEFLAIYWKDGKQPLTRQVKVGLAKSFQRFKEYHLAKYNRANDIKLADVLRMVHPKPESQEQAELWGRLRSNTLATPETWEVLLSSGADKKGSWTKLITEGKLPALAFMRNLRNMEGVGVSRETIVHGFKTIHPEWLLPVNYLAAAKNAPNYEREIEELMYRGLSAIKKLPGHSVFVVDVSGSMGCTVSPKSIFTRMQVGAAMTMLASEACESISVYATAGSDAANKHATERLAPRRGFALMDEVTKAAERLGGGGIFTRQCLGYIKTQETVKPDRIIIFSDSQDCDRHNKIPDPFGNKNYIIDVSSHKHGINYKGVWTAEISGWSEHFLKYVAEAENLI